MCPYCLTALVLLLLLLLLQFVNLSSALVHHVYDREPVPVLAYCSSCYHSLPLCCYTCALDMTVTVVSATPETPYYLNQGFLPKDPPRESKEHPIFVRDFGLL